MTPFDPPFSGFIQPPDVPPDPTGEEWRGEPGPPGPASTVPGPEGPRGPKGDPGVTNGMAEVGGFKIIDDATADVQISFQDVDGFEAGVVDNDGIFRLSVAEVDGSVLAPVYLLPNTTITEIDDGDDGVWFSDPDGFVAFGIETDGTLIGATSGGGGGGSTGDYSSADLVARDARAIAASMIVRDQSNSAVTAPLFGYSHVIAYGQSLTVGTDGTPVLSTVQPFDSVCLGTESRNVNLGTGVTFVPHGDAHFHALVAGGAEVPTVEATNTWRQLQLQWRSVSLDAGRRLVTNTAGVGGTTIEQLQKGASPNIYGAIPDLINQSKTEATSVLATTYGVAAIVWMQGEANYSTGSGGTHDQAAYLALFKQLVSDLRADIASITGQKSPPAVFVVQANSLLDTTGDICAIGNAQIQAAQEDQSVYLVSPYYQAVDTGGAHMTADGYRWTGGKIGQVMHKVLDRREGWMALSPVAAWFKGFTILLELHTPEPPLRSVPAFVADVQTMYPDLGFTVGDDLGGNAIVSVTLQQSTVVIVVTRQLIADNNPWLQYADNTHHQGNGNVQDSDPGIALDIFTETGKPYSMANALVAFRVPVLADPN